MRENRSIIIVLQSNFIYELLSVQIDYLNISSKSEEEETNITDDHRLATLA